MHVSASTADLWLSSDERVAPGQRVTTAAIAASTLAPEDLTTHSDDRRAVGQRETVPYPATGELSFRDFLSALNPLQHLPIIGTLYRDVTGDTLKPEARLAGGMIYGGPLGFLVAAINAAAEEETGRDLGAQTLAALRGEDTSVPPEGSAAAVRLAMANANAPATAALAATAPPAATGAASDSNTQATAPGAVETAPLVEDRALTQANGGIPVSTAGPATAALAVSPAQATRAPGAVSQPAATSTVATASVPAATGAAGPALSAEQAAGPAAATGLTTRSGLPGAGSITPASVAVQMQAQQAQQQAPMAAAAAGAVPTAGGATPPATTTVAEAGVDRAGRAQRTFEAPQRTNNTQPRMPQPAFRSDLTPGARQNGNSLQVTRDAPVGPTPLTPASAAATAPVAPVAPAGMTGNVTVPDAMQRALDKYDALLRTRQTGTSINQNS
ncbi:MAG: hypothetical protein SF002_16940 [Alphaproteobacteria bacterium]|nr:hypothetical protein [Alphaproteobacteria bacterium]